MHSGYTVVSAHILTLWCAMQIHEEQMARHKDLPRHIFEGHPEMVNLPRTGPGYFEGSALGKDGKLPITAEVLRYFTGAELPPKGVPGISMTWATPHLSDRHLATSETPVRCHPRTQCVCKWRESRPKAQISALLHSP